MVKLILFHRCRRNHDGIDRLNPDDTKNLGAFNQSGDTWRDRCRNAALQIATLATM
jgi:hypothetical protein